jgi:hypothetical protein
MVNTVPGTIVVPYVYENVCQQPVARIVASRLRAQFLTQLFNTNKQFCTSFAVNHPYSCQNKIKFSTKSSQQKTSVVLIYDGRPHIIQFSPYSDFASWPKGTLPDQSRGNIFSRALTSLFLFLNSYQPRVPVSVSNFER